MGSDDRNYLKFDLKKRRCNCKENVCCTPPPGKKLHCCWCCFRKQLKDAEFQRYGPYLLHPPKNYMYEYPNLREDEHLIRK
jgi:hypothetical protein